MKYLEEDGIKRNWLRFKFEWKAFKKHWKLQPKSHAPVTNFFVELCRATPFLAGHIWLFNIIIAVSVIAYLIWR